ncbi:alpha-1,3-rhamnosyltransferase [Acinetobacter calcoaceticus]|uniref:Alpha-1,3-rhamnosyltransferase n=1 Tax=Acinetobacter calcoaceticus TaxID=471 RepID=A0A4R1XUH3_ACICA|nr:alpha-1,3-rhamnosyltransferase [Acinetobacter calcoaceticus]
MNNSLPLVSIVVPCYNHENYISQCIQSIIDQSYHNIELIVIDDGSEDQSIEKILEIADACKNRFVNFIFRHRENKGLCATLNEALTLCHGEYFCIIASDDLMRINKTKIQVDYALKYPDVTSFYGGVQLIDDNGALKEKIDLPFQLYTFDKIFMHKFILYAPTQMHRLKDIVDLGGFDENVKVEDWELWLRLTKSGKKILCIPEQLAYYRIHMFNISKNNELMLKDLLNIIEGYRNESGFKKARFNILKQYVINPMREVSQMKYYIIKLICKLKNTLH